MAEWVEEQSGRWTLGVGSLRAKITPQRDIFTWWIEDDLSSSGFGVPLVRAVATLDAAKAAAEQALREMHDALVAHFAPVLRWNDGRAEIKELGWKLWAYSSGYTLQNTRIRIEGRCVQLLTEDENRSAAETALRAMGVVFRTEGE